MKAIIYARVSTANQNCQRQIDDLTEYAKAKHAHIIDIVAETGSGGKKNQQRKGITNLMQRARSREFDAIFITELSRLGRQAFELQKLIEELTEYGVCIYIQSMGLQTLDAKGKRSPMVDLMLSIIGQFAQMEREYIIERINSGLERAKREGKTLGRRKGTGKTREEILSEYSSVVKDLRAGISIRKVAKIHGLTPPTVQKVKSAANL